MAIPMVLGIVALALAEISPSVLSSVDVAIYGLVAGVFFIGFLVGLVKLWRLPNQVKQWLPISNRWLIVFTFLAGGLQKLHEEVGLGSQMELLIGLFCIVIFVTMTYRLIYTPVAIKVPASNQITEPT